MSSPGVGPSTMQPQSSLKCAFCPQSYPTTKELVHHVASIHDRWRCVGPSCRSELIRGYENLIAHHVSEKHETLCAVSCNMCSKKSKNFPNWRRHAKQKHRGVIIFPAEKPSNGQTTSGQRDDMEAPTIDLDSDDENGTEDEVGQNVDESPTSDKNGKSGDDDAAVESFRCRACFCRLESEDEREALIHAENKHEAREADGKAPCQVCGKFVMYDKLAKHGFQKHIHKFEIHCPFCIKRMKYIELMSHAMTCSERPQKLDDDTIQRALTEGCIPVPQSLPVLTIIMPSDTTRPEKIVNSVVPAKAPIIPSVDIKTEQFILFNGK